jgi:hypothetical protein
MDQRHERPRTDLSASTTNTTDLGATDMDGEPRMCTSGFMAGSSTELPRELIVRRCQPEHTPLMREGPTALTAAAARRGDGRSGASRPNMHQDRATPAPAHRWRDERHDHDVGLAPTSSHTEHMTGKRRRRSDRRQVSHGNDKRNQGLQFRESSRATHPDEHRDGAAARPLPTGAAAAGQARAAPVETSRIVVAPW